MNNALKMTTALILCLTLAACFALRQPDALPKPLRTLHVQSSDPYNTFTIKLKRTLRHMQVELTPDASYMLTINQTTFTHSTPTVGTSTQVRTYRLTYTIHFSLAHGNKHGKHIHVVLPEQALITHRELILNINQLLDTNNEFEIIRNEMENAIISKLLNHLYSKQVRDQLK